MEAMMNAWKARGRELMKEWGKGTPWYERGEELARGEL
jgi:hypothetical protein